MEMSPRETVSPAYPQLEIGHAPEAPARDVRRPEAPLPSSAPQLVPEGARALLAGTAEPSHECENCGKVTTTELYSIATKPEVMLPLQGRDDAGRRVSLGHYLRQHRGRPYSISTVTGDAIEVRITKASPEGASHTAWRLKPSASLAGVSIPSHANFGVSITPWDAESAETRKTRGGVVEKPATPGREPGEDDPGLFASGTVTPKICSTCHCPRFWRSRAAVITCATCHPPAVETLVAQWIGPDDARRVRA